MVNERETKPVVYEEAAIRQICPVCGRVCSENAIDFFGEIVGCEKCVSFEKAEDECTADDNREW